jgi:hypothetical protein
MNTVMFEVRLNGKPVFHGSDIVAAERMYQLHVSMAEAEGYESVILVSDDVDGKGAPWKAEHVWYKTHEDSSPRTR